MDSPPCRLCFSGVSCEQVGRYRVELDPEGIGKTILEELEAGGVPDGETIVAFALKRETWN